MSAKGQLLQDPFLNTLRKEHIPVSIYLVNGIKLQGHIDSFDQYVVLLKNTVTQMVYKHAISTVVPARAVTIHLRGLPHLMLDRPTGNVPNASTVVLVSLDFSDGDYAENLEELRQLAASDGLAISAVVEGETLPARSCHLRGQWQSGRNLAGIRTNRRIAGDFQS